MGYRSQVAIAFDSSLLPIWRKHTEKHEEWIKEESSDYHEINAMDAAISEFEYDPDHNELFQFIRIGESTDDIHEMGCLWHFQVHRTIQPAE